MPWFSQQSGDLFSLFLALIVGLIVGAERGWHERYPEDGKEPETGIDVAGIRTFALTGLCGGVVIMLTGATSIWLLPATLLVLGGLLVVTYLSTSRLSGDYGTTTEMALLLTFLLGALAVSGRHVEAIAAAVITASLLGFKTEIHSTLARLNRREMLSTLQLLLIAAVVLPLLPNRDLGPWQSLNPRILGLLILLIAGIGFAGYFSIRLIGARAGLMVTALLGGLTSSTAVTVSFARLAKRSGQRHALLGAAIALACGTMVPRMLVEVSAVNAGLVPLILPGLAALAVVPLVAAIWVARRFGDHEKTGDVGISNPLELTQALIIGAVLAAIFVISHAARAWLGDAGVYAVALISGVADVDAISLAVAQQAHSAGLAPETAANAIVLAALSNTAFKAAFAFAIGGPKLAKWASTILLIALVAGIAGMLLV